jgi:hypothetical protein
MPLGSASGVALLGRRVLSSALHLCTLLAKVSSHPFCQNATQNYRCCPIGQIRYEWAHVQFHSSDTDITQRTNSNAKAKTGNHCGGKPRVFGPEVKLEYFSFTLLVKLVLLVSKETRSSRFLDFFDFIKIKETN